MIPFRFWTNTVPVGWQEAEGEFGVDFGGVETGGRGRNGASEGFGEVPEGDGEEEKGEKGLGRGRQAKLVWPGWEPGEPGIRSRAGLSRRGAGLGQGAWPGRQSD